MIEASRSALAQYVEARDRLDTYMQSNGPIRGVGVKNALFIFFVGNALDVFSTYISISTVPTTYEANPIPRFFITHLGLVPGLVIHKLTIAFAIALFCAAILHSYRTKSLIVYYSVTGLGAAIVAIHNFRLVAAFHVW